MRRVTSAVGDKAEITASLKARGWRNALPDAKAVAVRAAAAAVAAACPGLGAAGVAIVLTGDGAVRRLNRDWRGCDSPTNVLSFPAADILEGAMPKPDIAGMPLELGDVVLAWETCAAEASAQRKPLADHVGHLVVHGVLHLLGYDHEAEDAAERMEGLETRVLALLGIPDPYTA